MVCINSMNINEFHFIPNINSKTSGILVREITNLLFPIPDYSVKLLFPDHRCNI